MPTQILATAATDASSGDVTVTGTLAVALKGVDAGPPDSGALVRIELKDDAGTYTVIGKITSADPSAVITAPGTYRFSRVGGAKCGVFSG